MDMLTVPRMAGVPFRLPSLLRCNPLRMTALLAVLIALAACSNGQPAADFVLTTFQGEKFRLSEQRGNAVVINFWYPSCPPCRDEMPAFQEVWEEYQGRNVRFIGLFVPQGFDTEVEARQFVDEFGLTFDFATDVRARVAQEYAVQFFPTTYFIDQAGRDAPHGNQPNGRGPIDRHPGRTGGLMDILGIILLAIRWAHALAAVVWIGGSLFMLLAGRPALRAADSGGLVGRALAAEFRPIVVTAIAVLIVSGVILTVDRLTSDAAGMAYTAVLVAKILLAVYAFIVAWLLPRRRDRPAGGIGGAVTGPVALTIAGVLVIGLADVLTWFFEKGLAG